MDADDLSGALEDFFLRRASGQHVQRLFGTIAEYFA
jgi:hypothetical protein